MTTIETPRTDGPNLPPDFPSGGFGGDANNGGERGPAKVEQPQSAWQRMSALVLRTFGLHHVEAPELMSEHFDHASKSRDLSPRFESKIIL